ncbi:MAG: hypothetical protein ABI599_05100 [Flavobacteriales bacterium]
MNPRTTVYTMRQHTARRLGHFQAQPIRLVPTMTPQEVAREGRKQLPTLHLAVLAECKSLLQQGTPVEHLLNHTTHDGNNWWVLVSIAPQGVGITALLRYRTPDQRLQAMRFDGIERTAHHYSADVLEPILKRMDGDRDPHQRLGRFLRESCNAPFTVVGADEAGQRTVTSTLLNQRVAGTWHVPYDLVCYHESRVADSEEPTLPGSSTVGRGG